MFFTKKKQQELKERIERLEEFEKAVVQIIDWYSYRNNEQKDGRYCMDNAADRFLLFVENIDKRFYEQAEEIRRLKEIVEKNGS